MHDTRTRRLRTGLRLRIAATIAGIVLVAVAGLGVAVHLLVVANRVSDARDAASQRLLAAMNIYSSTGLLAFDARVDDPSLPRELRGTLVHPGSRGTLVRGGSVRDVWAAGRIQDTVISTHTRIRAVGTPVRQVDRALLVAGLATVLVATLVGLLSAARLARRLRVAARTARGLAVGGGPPASMKDAVGPRSDEVGDLADAVDGLTERLADRIRAEQRFTADVAHDLRTPVTGLITAAALLDASRPAELVRDRAAALHSLVEELLEVARLDRGSEIAELQPVRLSEVVERAVRRGVAAGEYAEEAVVLRTEDGPAAGTVRTDPRRLERVLSNLVRNALTHGAPPVEIDQQGRLVVIRDHGPGFDAPMLAEGPQPFRRRRRPGVPGNGLGLVIAAGQSAVLGGSLDLANAPGGGARVTLRLPEDEPGDEPGDGPGAPSDLTIGSRRHRRTGSRS